MDATPSRCAPFRRSNIRLLAVASFLLVGVPQVIATCYHPNGNIVTETDYVPCNNSIAGVNAPSMCCGLNRTGVFPLIADQCLDNGLCKYQYSESSGNVVTQYWRDSCSIKDWSGNCLDVCGWINDGNTQVTPCASDGNTTKWCCGENNVDCCNDWSHDSSAFQIPLKLGDTLASSSTSSAAASTTTASASGTTATTTVATVASETTSSATSSAAAAKSSGVSPGAIGGAVVGAVAGVAAIGVVSFLLMRRRRTRPAPMESAPYPDPSQAMSGGLAHEKDAHIPSTYYSSASPGTAQVSSLGASFHGRSELSTHDSRYEMEGSTSPGTYGRGELDANPLGAAVELPAGDIPSYPNDVNHNH